VDLHHRESVTVFIAIFAIFILPNYPSNTSWLSPEERAVAEWRLISDAGQVDKDNEDWSYGFKMAFKDWRLYVFALIFLCIQVASATSNFFPTVVKTLGYNTVETLLLTVTPYMLGLVVSIANNWLADRFQNSSFHAIGPMMAAIVGFVVAAASLTLGRATLQWSSWLLEAMGPMQWCWPGPKRQCYVPESSVPPRWLL
jgi:Na+/melibiose symporter-like transporter